MPLRDARLHRRFEGIVAAMAKSPDRSFPKVFTTDSELEATYRFLSNERITHEALLAEHVEQTVARVAQSGTVLAVHDSTAFTFGGDQGRDDVGSLDGKRAGFLGHFALAVTAGDERRVLGVLGLEPTFRLDGPRRTELRARENRPDRESLRWLRMVDLVRSSVADVIHVMDSEGDDYALLAHLDQHRQRFVIRTAYDRCVEPAGKVATALAATETVACRTVPLSVRTRLASRGHKSRRLPRQARTAKLQIRATTLTLCRPDRRNTLPPTLTLNVVHVYEVDVPPGEQAVDWKLYTSEPIDTPEQVLAVVDYYRNRWVIEEFFKALKTGCAYEKRQLESRHALLNALALLVPIAWQLLVLRDESRCEALVGTALTGQQIEVLRAVSKRPLPPVLTAREIMLAVAALGGHIKNNGDPGWIVLGRGFMDLLAYEVGWIAGRASRSDQS
jgi:hypothetical protein